MPFQHTICAPPLHKYLIRSGISTRMTSEIGKILCLNVYIFRTVRRAMLLLVVLWLVVLILLSPVLFISTTMDLPDSSGDVTFACIEFFPTAALRSVYVNMIFVLLYIVPLVIISLCYIAMARTLCKQRQGSIGATNMQCQGRRPSFCKRRLIRMILCVVLVFAVCWLPLHIVYIVTELVTPSTRFQEFKQIAQCLTYMCSVINPCIYSFMNHTFRKAFKSIMEGCGHPQGDARKARKSGSSYTTKSETTRRSLSEGTGKPKGNIILNLLQEFNPHEDQLKPERFSNESLNSNELNSHKNDTKSRELCRASMAMKYSVSITPNSSTQDTQTTMTSQDLDSGNPPDYMTSQEEYCQEQIGLLRTSDEHVDQNSQDTPGIATRYHSSTQSLNYIDNRNGLLSVHGIKIGGNLQRSLPVCLPTAV